MFGGSYRNPEKTSDNCKASAQTGEVPAKPTEFIVSCHPRGLKVNLSSGFKLLCSLHFEALLAPFSICLKVSFFSS